MNFNNHVINYGPIIFEDERGYLKVISEDKKRGVAYKESLSKKGVFRGMHIQIPPFSQTKHIMLAQGRVIDYIIALDKNSPDFGKVFFREINHSERIYNIPEYCAHGYYAIEDSILRYLCIGQYSEKNEISISECTQGKKDLIISYKDRRGITMDDAVKLFKTITW
jgi:dTDP-4-dehydrorhamnose 3,5-epimerase